MTPASFPDLFPDEVPEAVPAVFPEPLAFGQRVASLIEFGRRNSTYKLATLMAIVDVCTEHSPGPDGTLHVPIQELAHRVVAYYWRQARPFAQSGILRQNQQSGQSLPMLIASTRMSLATRGIPTAEGAREAEDVEYLRLIRRAEQLLARMPLTHLQSIPGAAPDDFIYDATGLGKKMTVAQLAGHGPIVLKPGVADAFQRLAPLLRPVIEIAWSADVATLNKAELDADDLPGFLFGHDRISLANIAPPLRELQDGRCFYCAGPIGAGAHVDHVLPWSKAPIDGVANLVLADPRCNLDKSATLPAREHVQRALARDAVDLGEIGARARLPVLLGRTRGAADGLYQALADGTQLWVGSGVYAPHQSMPG